MLGWPDHADILTSGCPEGLSWPLSEWRPQSSADTDGWCCGSHAGSARAGASICIGVWFLGISRRSSLGGAELEALGGVGSAPVSSPDCAASANEAMMRCNGNVVLEVKWAVVLLSSMDISSPRLQQWGRAAETAVNRPSEKRPALSHKKKRASLSQEDSRTRRRTCLGGATRFQQRSDGNRKGRERE